MKNKFSKEEIVELILNFYLSPMGYSKEEKREPEVAKCIEDGLCDYHTESERYLINEKGRTFLHVYIRSVTNEFIDIIRKHGKCTKKDAVEWFKKYFCLKDSETAAEICNYICDNAIKYGYRMDSCYFDGKEGICVEEI